MKHTYHLYDPASIFVADPLDDHEMQTVGPIDTFRQSIADTLDHCKALSGPNGGRQDTHGAFDQGMEATGKIMDILASLPFWMKLTPGQRAAIGVSIQKHVRMANGKHHGDDYDDAINYIAAAKAMAK